MLSTNGSGLPKQIQYYGPSQETNRESQAGSPTALFSALFTNVGSAEVPLTFTVVRLRAGRDGSPVPFGVDEGFATAIRIPADEAGFVPSLDGPAEVCDLRFPPEERLLPRCRLVTNGNWRALPYAQLTSENDARLLRWKQRSMEIKRKRAFALAVMSLTAALTVAGIVRVVQKGRIQDPQGTS